MQPLFTQGVFIKRNNDSLIFIILLDRLYTIWYNTETKTMRG